MATDLIFPRGQTRLAAPRAMNGWSELPTSWSMTSDVAARNSGSPTWLCWKRDGAVRPGCRQARWHL